MMCKNTDIAVVANSVNTVLQKQEALWKGIQDIDSSIAKNVGLLKKDLETLEDAEANISINRHWYGAVDIDTISKSLINVYDDLRQYIQTCGNAIRTTNENLSHALGLIRLLTMIEKELYEQLDNETIQGNVLKELIKDWCKKNNIRDEEVNQLLETCFQRAYTLRSRINDIRVEVREKFGYYDIELEKLSKNIESQKNSITTEKDKAIKELMTLYAVKESLLNKFTAEKIIELKSLHANNLKESNNLLNTVVAKTNELAKDVNKQSEELSKQQSEVKNALKIHREEINKQQSEAIQKIENYITTCNKTYQDTIKSIAEEAHNKIVEYKNLCDASIKELLSYKKQTDEERTDFLLGAELALNSLQEKSELSIKTISEVSNESKEQIMELKKRVEIANQAEESRIKEQVETFEANLIKFQENQTKEYDNIKKTQQAVLAEAIDQANSLAKRWAIGGAIAGAILATATSLALSMFS